MTRHGVCQPAAFFTETMPSTASHLGSLGATASSNARRSEPILFHSGCPTQLSRPGHHPSDSRRTPAARSDGREAARALTSTARLARSADRARLCLSPIRTRKIHQHPCAPKRSPTSIGDRPCDFYQTICGDHIAENAVLEYGPTEILPQVGTMSTGPAALCRPRHRLTGHTRGKGRRFGAASPAAAKLTGETDWLQEGAGFEPSVPGRLQAKTPRFGIVLRRLLSSCGSFHIDHRLSCHVSPLIEFTV
jgi:hypothetical protein